MKLIGSLVIGLLGLPALAVESRAAGSLSASGLRCEYRVEAIGLDVREPRLSWVLKSDRRGDRQTAWQVLVASTPAPLAKHQGDLWDSGKVDNDQTLHVVYQGRPLTSRMRCHWKVRVWDREGRPSGWSQPALWTMGLLDRTDWQAEWIADPVSQTNTLPTKVHNGYHSHFTNRAEAVKAIAIDLGSIQECDGIRLFPARPYDWQPDAPGFLFPVRFRLELATQADYSDAAVVVDRTSRDEPNPGINAPVYRFASAKARYARVTVTRLRRRDADNYGVALAEMQVLQGDKNLALGRGVQVTDSIENGGWARNHLVDGILGPVPPGTKAPTPPTVRARKEFSVAGKIRRATVYATAQGLYELRLNGQRVGDQLLTPEWTSYRKRIQYQVYDVTRLVRSGANALGVTLAEGWHSGRLMIVGRNAYGTHPAFLMQLELELADGSRQMVTTDSTWHSTIEGPIRSASIYDGEIHDNRLAMPGWDQPGFVEGAAWRSTVVMPSVDAELVWQRNEPIRVLEELKPRKITEPRPGVYVADFGQNMVGWCRVEASGKPGSTITLRHAEMLNEDGTIYTNNLRSALQVDRFMLSGGGKEILEPHFTYHGFRYVEVSGLDRPLNSGDLAGRVFYSAARDVGTFACSDESLNRLMRNIYWTQRGNLMSSPNDCPQRDERFGWMGDIQVFSQTAIFNMDMAAFFGKFAQDVRDDQAEDGRFPDFAPHPGDPNRQFSSAPGWADAGTIIPWRVYENYADTRLLEAHFTAARRWVDYVRAANPDLVWRNGRGNDYNDWLNGDWIRQQDWPTKGAHVPKEVFATAFFAHSADLVSRMARVLGRATEAHEYASLFDRIKTVFNREFARPDGTIQGDTQAGYALALNFDLLPAEQRAKAAAHMVAGIRKYGGHLSTGIQTTSRLMAELSRNGKEQVAWQMVTNRTFPSWLYMIDNGATTVWERWDGYVRGRGFQDPGMNSFNHWAFGAVGEWLWRNVVGLNPDEAGPGYKQFVIRPRPGGGVTWAKGEYDSFRGRIACGWKMEKDRFTLDLTVPPGTTATVFLPAKSAETIQESGRPLGNIASLRVVGHKDGTSILSVESGRYSFTTRR